MFIRRLLFTLLVSFLVPMLLGASYRSTNFVVEAPTPQIAQAVGQWAEYWRHEKAQLWLGQEMPNWPEPCPLKATVTQGGAGGATSFVFDGGRVHGQSMHVEGPVDRLLSSVIPHEVTHTVLAYRFKRPLPRWIDEGAAVFSEDEKERRHHDQLCREILNGGRAIPLRRLFTLTEYPNDVMALYSQGYCVVNFLVAQGGREKLVGFLAAALQGDWDTAVRISYGYQDVNDLERVWLQHMKETKGSPLLSGGAVAIHHPQGQGTLATVPVQTAPAASPAPVATSDGSVLAALARLESKVDAVSRLRSDMDDLRVRLERLEASTGRGTEGWNTSPVRTQPVPVPVAPSVAVAQPQPYRPIVTQPFGQFSQPSCPDGRCPLQQRQ